MKVVMHSTELPPRETPVVCLTTHLPEDVVSDVLPCPGLWEYSSMQQPWDVYTTPKQFGQLCDANVTLVGLDNDTCLSIAHINDAD